MILETYVREDVHFACSCEVCCQKKSPRQKHIHSLATWKPSHPFWQVALDIMGPLPESSGNEYILLVEDHFTKWFEAFSMSNQEASTMAEAFVTYGFQVLVVLQISIATRAITSCRMFSGTCVKS